MFGLSLFRNHLRSTTRPCLVMKDRPSGERELFDLAYKTKHEVSWVYIVGADAWVNLTSDYRREISAGQVEYNVSMRQLENNTIFDGHLIFYHTHPKAAFTSAFRMLTKRPFYERFDGSAKKLLRNEERAYGHLVGEFHLPSVQDIETAVYLDERHGPGTVHVIISNLGASVTFIRNPPDENSAKMSIDELVHLYRHAHGSFRDFQQESILTVDLFNKPSVYALMRPQYGIINEQCDRRILVADLTSVASTKMGPMDHLLMKWLSTGEPMEEQFSRALVSTVTRRGDLELCTEFQHKVEALTDVGEYAAELEKLEAGIHRDVAQELASIVGEESADLYAEFTIKALKGFYDCVED